MRVFIPVFMLAITATTLSPAQAADERPAEVAAADSAQAAAPDRMAWWREARFGMFIHWGLYAIPAGEWNGRTDHAEWIRTTARIPLAEYDKLKDRFNPSSFDAKSIVRAAKNAGMRYIVITSKHHDGFCLFHSKLTDWDVMSTPFKRDIIKEMAEACRAEGIRFGLYYSIMDWHHPDYLPRRDWEKDRPTDGASFDRYVEYMKGQLKELLTGYGPIAVLWFDGQWEHNWNDERGRDLEQFVRSLQPNIIINSRVGRGGGDWGLDGKSRMLGDFATPEQHIPETGFPGLDWETCMTMNDHWGYNAADSNFKTTSDLLQKLADIAGKGGNFLLNIGPTAEGRIPPQSVERLDAIDEWMDLNGESIHGTLAGPFPKLAWGRCTQDAETNIPGKTRLYLHVFDWPADGKLVVPGITNTVNENSAFVLSDPTHPVIAVGREDDALIVHIPSARPDASDSVVVLDVNGRPDINLPPTISAEATIFVDSLSVTARSDRENVVVRYTLDGTDPTASAHAMGGVGGGGAVVIDRTVTFKARCFREDAPVSPASSARFEKVTPRPAESDSQVSPGLRAEFFELPGGDVKSVAALDSLAAAKSARVQGFDLSARPRDKHWGARFTGFLRVPKTGVYHLTTGSDDGSRLWIGPTLVVDNDEPHSFKEVSGSIALSAGLHPIHVDFFENWGGFDLKVMWSGPGIERQNIPNEALLSSP